MSESLGVTKALVTGGAGFIGSHLVKELIKKSDIEEVYIVDSLTYAGNLLNLKDVDKSRYKLVVGDVANGQLMADVVSNVDIVYHLAAETHVTRSIYDNYQFFHTDVIGTQAVANAVTREATKRNRPVSMVHLSTSEVYGTAVKEYMDENHPLNPCSPYAAAKAGADRLVYSYSSTYGLDAIIIRPFNQYGSNQHPEKLIPRFITSAIQGKPLNVHGDGRAARDWVHVSDTTSFLANLYNRNFSEIRGEVFNIGSDESRSINDIYKYIRRRFPDAIKVNVEERPGQVMRHTCSSQKAKELLGWNPVHCIDNSLDEVVDWYLANQDVWMPLTLTQSVEIEIVPGKTVRH